MSNHSICRERRRLFNPRARADSASRMLSRRDRLRRLVPGHTRGLLRLAVAAEFGVDVELMQSARRFQALVEARMAYTLIAYRRMRASSTCVGVALGGRDHTTILHALRRAEAREAADPAFAARLARIEAVLWPQTQEIAA